MMSLYFNGGGAVFTAGGLPIISSKVGTTAKPGPIVLRIFSFMSATLSG